MAYVKFCRRRLRDAFTATDASPWRGSLGLLRGDITHAAVIVRVSVRRTMASFDRIAVVISL